MWLLLKKTGKINVRPTQAWCLSGNNMAQEADTVCISVFMLPTVPAWKTHVCTYRTITTECSFKLNYTEITKYYRNLSDFSSSEKSSSHKELFEKWLHLISVTFHTSQCSTKTGALPSGQWQQHGCQPDMIIWLVCAFQCSSSMGIVTL